jgi:hypothetical protein
MFSSKKVFVLASLVCVFAMAVGAAAAKADWMTPTIYDSSPAHGSDGLAINCVDHDLATHAKLGDDSLPADVTDTTVTGYFVFDLGATQDVSGFKFWARNHANNLNPKDVDFFYWNNDAVNAHKFTPNTSDQIALDSNVVFASSMTFPGVNLNNSYQVDFTPAQKFTARYVGLRVRSDYDTNPGADITFAEVQLNASAPVSTPEPTSIVLLASGVIGLLCYAWRKRK